MPKLLRLSFPGVLVLSAVLAASAQAAVDGLVYTVEPIVGAETTHKTRPTPHTGIRLLYGARVSAGYREIALEGEGTRATDREDFPLQSYSARDTDDRIKLGLRRSWFLDSRFSLDARAGGQAKRNIHEQTSQGISTRTVGRISYRPYFGMGGSASLSSLFDLTVGITAVFNDPPAGKTEFQGSFGFRALF